MVARRWEQFSESGIHLEARRITVQIQDLIRQIIPDENRWCACMFGIDKLLTAHIEAATGTRVAGPLNYNFPARTADEIEATQGHDATRIRPQRSSEAAREMPRPSNPAPGPVPQISTQPRKPRLPY
jgi:hypothetical protein